MITKNRLISIAILWILSAHVSAQSLNELLDKANLAVQNQTYSEALIHLKNAAKQDPGNKQVHLRLAQLFVATGQGIQAGEELNRLQRIGATAEETAVLTAKALYLQGEYQQIIDRVDLLDLSQQEIARYRAMQGHALYAQLKYNQAQQMFRRALQLDQDAVEVQLGQVKIYRMEKQSEQEKVLVLSLLKEYPNNAEVLLEAGETFRLAGEFERALEIFLQAGHMQLSNVNVWFGVVRSHIGLQDYASAKKEIQKILAAYPEHQVANYLLAIISFEEKNYHRAKSAIDIVLKGEKRKFEALLLLASIQFQLKEYSPAESNLKKYLASYPNDVQALKSLAAVYLKRKQSVQALEILLKLEPLQDAYIYSMIASAYLIAGNTEKSGQYVRKSMQAAPDNQRIQRRFQRNQLEAGQALNLEFADTDYNNFLSEGHITILDLIVRREYDRAVEILQGYMTAMPRYALLHYLLGTVHLARSDTEAARKEFNKAVEIQPDMIESHIYLAKIYARGNRVRDAERAYREVLKFDINNDQALVGLAALFKSQGDETEMLKWLNRSRRANSASLASREVLERFYREKGDVLKASEISQEMVRIQPQNIMLLRRHALNQKSIGRLDLAINTFEYIVKIKPALVSAWSGLGHLQFLQGELLQAEKSYRQVLELNPKDVVARVILIQIDIKFGRLQVALVKANELQRIHPENAAGYDMQGDVYIRMNKPARAIQAYRKSVELKFSSDTYLKLYSAYNRNNQFGEGFELLQDWVTRFPQDLALKEALAITYFRQGEHQKSLELYEQILEKNRKNDRILNGLALVTLELDNPMSMEYAELAYNINPDNIENWDTLGWVLLKNQNAEKALGLLETAVKKAPSNSDYRYHYALALSETGNNKAAMTQLYLAINAEGQFENKAAAIKLLEELKSRSD